MITQAVIFAGGLGTRLLPLTKENPKPLIDINGKPFMDYLLHLLKRNGITEVILLVGYLHEKIIDYYGDGSTIGIKISYGIGDAKDQTGKRLLQVREQLKEEFLLMYCDNYLPFNMENFYTHFKSKDALAQVTIYSNKDNFTKSNMRLDEEGYVTLYDRSRTEKNLSGVDIGYFIIKKEALKYLPETNEAFQDTVLPALIKDKKLVGVLTDQRYYSIGKFDRLEGTKKFLSPKKTIFLDRDGVINVKAPKADYIKKWEEFVFLPGVLESFSLLNKKGYLVYLISNQAGIARGMMTEEDLKDIHEKMIAEIEKAGGHIEQIYYCPHGWNEECDCRKPKPGMFFEASKNHFIDLSTSLFIGDDVRDKEAGDAAGITTILIDGKEKTLLDVVKGLP